MPANGSGFRGFGWKDYAAVAQEKVCAKAVASNAFEDAHGFLPRF